MPTHTHTEPGLASCLYVDHVFLKGKMYTLLELERIPSPVRYTTYSLSHSRTLSHTIFHSHTHSLSLSLSFTHTLTLSLSLKVDAREMVAEFSPIIEW